MWQTTTRRRRTAATKLTRQVNKRPREDKEGWEKQLFGAGEGAQSGGGGRGGGGGRKQSASETSGGVAWPKHGMAISDSGC